MCRGGGGQRSKKNGMSVCFAHVLTHVQEHHQQTHQVIKFYQSTLDLYLQSKWLNVQSTLDLYLQLHEHPSPRRAHINYWN